MERVNSTHTRRVRVFSPNEKKRVDLYIAIDKQGWVKKVNSTHTRRVRVFSPNEKKESRFIHSFRQAGVGGKGELGTYSESVRGFPPRMEKQYSKDNVINHFLRFVPECSPVLVQLHSGWVARPQVIAWWLSSHHRTKVG